MDEPTSTGADFPQLKPLGQHADKSPIRIHRPVFMIGSRHSAHLHLLSRQVSKAHAVILKDEQGLYLRDLCSRTHVYVNDQPVTQAWLRDGDEIKIGAFTFGLLGHGFDKGEHHTLPPGQLQPLDQEQPVALNERVVMIGRREGCEIPVADPTVSAEHAIVFAMGGAWHVRDLGSRTGTFVNGQQIHQKRLEAGDAVRVGPLELRFSPVSLSQEVQAEGVADLDQLVAEGLGEQAVPPVEEEKPPVTDQASAAIEPADKAVEEIQAPQGEGPLELIEPVVESLDVLPLVGEPAVEPVEAEPSAAKAESAPPSEGIAQEPPPDLIELENDVEPPLLIDDELRAEKLSSSATRTDSESVVEQTPVEAVEEKGDKAIPEETLTQPLPEAVEEPAEETSPPEGDVEAPQAADAEQSDADLRPVELESPLLEAPLAQPIELESPLLEAPQPQAIELESPVVEVPLAEAHEEPVAEPEMPMEAVEAMESPALDSVEVEPEAQRDVQLLEPDVEASTAAAEPAPGADETHAPVVLDKFEPELLPLEASSESSSGELDFSNLKLDRLEPPGDIAVKPELGLELLEPHEPHIEGPTRASENEPQVPAAAADAAASADDLSLIPLDALESALDDSAPATPSQVTPESPASEPIIADLPPTAPATNRRGRRAPRRGPDGKFLKRGQIPEKETQAAAETAVQPVTPTADDSAPASPAEQNVEVATSQPPVTSPPAASAPEAPAKSKPAGDPRSLMGLGVNQGGFFGGIPLGLEPPPKTAAPAPAPPAPPTPPRMLHPFDWNADAAAAGGKTDIPPYREPRGGVRSTGFDGLAMPPVRETDVFSQTPVASDALLNIPFDDSGAPAAPAANTPAGKSPRRAAPLDQMRWRPPPPPPPPVAPRKRRWFGLSLLLGLMFLCMAGAAGGIWQFMRPQSLVQGILPFVGPRPTLGQQHQQLELLKNPLTQQAARRIVQQEHLEGGFLNSEPAFTQLASNAQWSGEGLVISRTTGDAAGDQQRLAAVVTSMYRSADNQRLVDQRANLVRQVENLKSSETDARDGLRDLERRIKTLEDNPPPMPTEAQRSEITQRLADLKQEWEGGAARPASGAVSDNWLLASLLPAPQLWSNVTGESAARPDADVQTQYLQALVAQQKMQAQLEEGGRYERRLHDLRDQRRSAQLAVQHAAEARANAEERVAAAIAPQSPVEPTAIALADPRPVYMAICLGGIAAAFAFLICLTLLVGRSSVPMALERPQPIPQPRPADDLFAHELANPQDPSAIPTSPVSDRRELKL